MSLWIVPQQIVPRSGASHTVRYVWPITYSMAHITKENRLRISPRSVRRQDSTSLVPYLLPLAANAIEIGGEHTAAFLLLSCAGRGPAA
jgi:hypothetical protein